MRAFLLPAAIAMIACSTSVYAGDSSVNINVNGVQNIASMTQIGLLNFQLLAQGQTASIQAPQTGAYLDVQQALLNLAPNSTAIISILNTGVTINAGSGIDAPVDISILNSAN